MKQRTRYQGVFRQISSHWPLFLNLYGGLALALFVAGISLQRGWLSFVPLMLALSLIFGYFLTTALWAAHKLHDLDGLRPYDVLFDLGQIQAADKIVYVGLGLRHAPLHLRRRLTTGKLIVVDVYNPQWTPGKPLARARAAAPPVTPDPRLVWQNGRFDLLPLPDKSVPYVMLDQVLSQFWQRGDRLHLLQEAHRILTPNGRLLLSERIRSQTNWLVLGPGGAQLQTLEYWQTLLQEAGFVVRRQKDLQGLVYCFRADKPSATEARQLALDLPL